MIESAFLLNIPLTNTPNSNGTKPNDGDITDLFAMLIQALTEIRQSQNDDGNNLPFDLQKREEKFEDGNDAFPPLAVFSLTPTIDPGNALIAQETNFSKEKLNQEGGPNPKSTPNNPTPSQGLVPLSLGDFASQNTPKPSDAPANPINNAALPFRPVASAGKQEIIPLVDKLPATKGNLIDPGFGNLATTIHLNARPNADFVNHVRQNLPYHPLSSPGEQVAIQVSRAALEKLDKIDITLSPPDLGKVKVSLSFDEDKKVIAIFNVEKAQTMDLLYRDQKEITQSLNNIGFKTDESALRFELSQQQGEQSQQHQTLKSEEHFRSPAHLEEEDADLVASANNNSLIDLAI